jgi:hypothetical protein
MDRLSELRFDINLLGDGSVVTRDGEYLGTWDTDETDALYEFTPDGASEPLFFDPFRGPLCQAIEEWRSTSRSLSAEQQGPSR